MIYLRQSGFSLTETLVAALLFSLSLLGLLQYYQVLAYSFQYQWQGARAWQLAHQRLESAEFATASGDAGSSSLAEGWRLQVSRSFPTAGCRRIGVSVMPPLHPPVQLARWFCGTMQE